MVYGVHGKLNSNGNVESYGFKSVKCPPAIQEMTDFENDLQQIIENVEFRQISNNFQGKLKNDIDHIKKSNKIFVFADKSRNIYEVEQEEYKKLLKENLKKSNLTRVYNINKNAKKITEKLPISDRIEKMQETKAYITIKDHKESFPNKISCRLINPSKSSVCNISKVILDKINNRIEKKTSANQWRGTSSVIEWFVNIKEKERSSFMVFDIESFYPSITERLFNNAIQFAKQIIEISMSLINQSRKTLLFNEKITWVKKDGSEDFDVPMGCFDGAEVCELVETFILNKLKNVFQKNTFGLYRDDGLAVIKGLSSPEIEILKKNVVKTFKYC